jgi:hypothetical protein
MAGLGGSTLGSPFAYPMQGNPCCEQLDYRLAVLAVLPQLEVRGCPHPSALSCPEPTLQPFVEQHHARMDEVYHPETVEAILDFTYRITKAISGPSA